jgi:hypothetical protein
MAALQIKPKQVVKRLIAVLPPRSREVISARYGLNSVEPMTLEAIGKKYGITRERVRQIENHALANIRKSDVFKKEKEGFTELENYLHSLGGVVSEKDLLDSIGKEDQITKNHILLLLEIGETFIKEKEDDMFHHRWHVDPELARRVHESLRKLYKNLNSEDLVPESDMITSFLENLKEVSERYKNEEVLRRWLSMTKTMGKNPLGEWGLTASPNIKAKGMRDYAFLVIRRHGSPIHFREVARLITDLFGKKAHVATTHNELIKDPRFVLVGRGLYALSEWGYMSGVVRDVIKHVIEKNGPLSKDEVIEKVMKERYVKPNTIIVNLQNQKYFKKDREGKYSVVK